MEGGEGEVAGGVGLSRAADELVLVDCEDRLGRVRNFRRVCELCCMIAIMLRLEFQNHAVTIDALL